MTRTTAARRRIRQAARNARAGLADRHLAAADLPAAGKPDHISQPATTAHTREDRA